jgi:hypothetical protein
VKSEPLTPDQKIARIKKALHYGGDAQTWDDVRDGLSKGNYQIFDSDDGVMITEINQLPSGRYIKVFIAAGRLPGIMDLVPKIEKFARAEGCQSLLANGRRGWAKILPDYGWKEVGVVYSKDVTHAT